MRPSLDEPLVYYMTEHQEQDGRKLFLFYPAFKKFLLDNFIVQDKAGLLEALDSHLVVHLDGKTGIFEAKTIYEGIKEPTFKTLLELNDKKKEDNQNYTGFKTKIQNATDKWKDIKSNAFSYRDYSKRRF